MGSTSGSSTELTVNCYTGHVKFASIRHVPEIRHLKNASYSLIFSCVLLIRDRDSLSISLYFEKFACKKWQPGIVASNMCELRAVILS